MKIGVVGATGVVGDKLIQLLNKTILPIDELRLIASERSTGKKVVFSKETIKVRPISDKVFENLDLVFFMATNDIAKKYVKVAVNKGCVVIDNSSVYRMIDEIPLVVPEVNFNEIKKTDRIIANPNCSTIQLVVILNALSKDNEIKRVDVSTYQAVSGAGKGAINELEDQIIHYRRGVKEARILPVKGLEKHYSILNNVIPQIDLFDDSGYSKEELKVIKESQKILKKNFSISCTAVRVPIINGHSESVTVAFINKVNLTQVFHNLWESENIIVMDDIENQVYPLAQHCRDKSEVFVGRIRKDYYDDHILHFWNVADNLLKGAAANALQIAEKCFEEKIYGW
ncbi:aspartate-semialdehyde dehydrogenase [Mycoplasmatota bacterium]|nr:aspartate-semialdehyde dehydrogenase [Mycoplasmatota bacterium]